MTFVVVFTATLLALSVSGSEAYPATYWTLQQLNHTIKSPHTDPAIAPYLNDGLNISQPITVCVPIKDSLTFDELAAIINDPETNPAVLPYLETAFRDYIQAALNGQNETTIVLDIPALNASIWTVQQLYSAIWDPNTDPKLIVYLKHAFNKILPDIYQGNELDTVAVITPPGIVAIPPEVSTDVFNSSTSFVPDISIINTSPEIPVNNESIVETNAVTKEPVITATTEITAIEPSPLLQILIDGISDQQGHVPVSPVMTAPIQDSQQTIESPANTATLVGVIESIDITPISESPLVNSNIVSQPSQVVPTDSGVLVGPQEVVGSVFKVQGPSINPLLNTYLEQEPIWSTLQAGVPMVGPTGVSPVTARSWTSPTVHSDASGPFVITDGAQLTKPVSPIGDWLGPETSFIGPDGVLRSIDSSGFFESTRPSDSFIGEFEKPQQVNVVSLADSYVGPDGLLRTNYILPTGHWVGLDKSGADVQQHTLVSPEFEHWVGGAQSNMQVSPTGSLVSLDGFVQAIQPVNVSPVSFDSWVVSPPEQIIQESPVGQNVYVENVGISTEVTTGPKVFNVVPQPIQAQVAVDRSCVPPEGTILEAAQSPIQVLPLVVNPYVNSILQEQSVQGPLPAGPWVALDAILQDIQQRISAPVSSVVVPDNVAQSVSKPSAVVFSISNEQSSQGFMAAGSWTAPTVVQEIPQSFVTPPAHSVVVNTVGQPNTNLPVVVVGNGIEQPIQDFPVAGSWITPDGVVQDISQSTMSDPVNSVVVTDSVEQPIQSLPALVVNNEIVESIQGPPLTTGPSIVPEAFVQEVPHTIISPSVSSIVVADYVGQPIQSLPPVLAPNKINPWVSPDTVAKEVPQTVFFSPVNSVVDTDRTGQLIQSIPNVAVTNEIEQPVSWVNSDVVVQEVPQTILSPSISSVVITDSVEQPIQAPRAGPWEDSDVPVSEAQQPFLPSPDSSIVVVDNFGTSTPRFSVVDDSSITSNAFVEVTQQPFEGNYLVVSNTNVEVPKQVIQNPPLTEVVEPVYTSLTVSPLVGSDSVNEVIPQVGASPVPARNWA